jgi:acyl carrier protein
VNDPAWSTAVELIRRELAILVQEGSVPIGQVSAASSLVDDLRLDSFSFVDLTLGLERAFGIREFPMQDWVDEQALKDDERFTVGALASACLEVQQREGIRPSSEIGNQ